MAAVAAAWAHARGGLALGAAGEPDSPPPEGGWDAITNVDYETSPAEGRVARAVARRYGALTYVALIDGDAAAQAQRGAQLETALSTLRPRGMHEESFAGRAPRPIDAARADELDAFIAGALARLEVPGAAVAVVRGGEVVYERAFGVRALGKGEPVTPQTLFMMGSITKPMTTLLQAALVDAGKLGWDTPLARVLPGFALGDEGVTGRLALWHTACACTGMPRRDLEILFEYEGVTPERRLASMKTMRPTTALGETFQYSNLMVAAGGYAAARAFDPRRPLGDAYAAAMRRLVFEPIGMASSTLDFGAAGRAEHATPHALGVDGAPRPVALAAERNVVPIAPAGGVWSNLRDMERYALTELARGVAPGGRRVASAANVVERWKLRVRDGDGEDSGYGLGMGVGPYRGLASIGHDGGTHGFGTTLFLLPEADAGIVILTNVRNGGDFAQLPFNAAVQRRLLEALFEGARPLAAAQVEYFARAKRAAAARAGEGLERAPEPAWARGLAGTYAEASLGTVKLRADA
ncbi:MAG TPA: serine hydrolase domain-containing protein, partial [Polyangiaceae bacterium]|nr:serine hydrolase domain-containing protein [Polyangiaceae bacterium]